MKTSREEIIPEVIRTLYYLKPFIPILYFATVYSILLFLESTLLPIVAGFLSLIGVVLIFIYIQQERDDIISDTRRVLHVVGILVFISSISIAVTYFYGDPLVFGASLISTLGILSMTDVSNNTLLKSTVIKLKSRGISTYDRVYPFHLHLIFALTHPRKEYGNFVANERMDPIMLSVVTDNQISLASFGSTEEYIEWMDETREIMVCEICHKEDCSGLDLDVEGIYASDFDVTRMSLCRSCESQLTRKLVSEDELDSAEMAAISM